MSVGIALFGILGAAGIVWISYWKIIGREISVAEEESTHRVQPYALRKNSTVRFCKNCGARILT